MQPMVKEHFKLKSTPFGKCIGSDNLFMYEQLEQLFAVLKETAEDLSMALVTGRAGTGKTTAVRAFTDTLPTNRYRTIYLGQDQRGNGMLHRLAHQIGMRGGPATKLMLSLTQRLEHDAVHSGKKLLVIIDEAHVLEQQTFDTIRMLTNFDMDRSSPMAVVLLGQHWLRNTLKSYAHEAMYQRLRLRYGLEGLSEQETKDYIAHHLGLVGCKEKIFDDKALAQIFAASEGILREINNICFESMLRAASLGQERVTGRIVTWVINQRELC